MIFASILRLTNLDSVSQWNFDHFVKYGFLMEGTSALRKLPTYRQSSSISSLLLVGIHVCLIFWSVGGCPRNRETPKLKLRSGHGANLRLTSLGSLSQWTRCRFEKSLGRIHSYCTTGVVILVDDKDWLAAASASAEPKVVPVNSEPSHGGSCGR